MRIKMKAGVLTLMVSGVLALFDAYSTANGAKAALVFTIKSEHPSVRSGVAPALEFTFSNRGDASVFFNRRALIDSRLAPAPYREIWLDVQPEGGKALNFVCKVRAGSAGRRDYILLHPGESFAKTASLDCFDLSKPGRYRIRAHFEDGTKEPPEPPTGALLFAGPAESNEISVVVEASR
jgi:hypothetical protein